MTVALARFPGGAASASADGSARLDAARLGGHRARGADQGPGGGGHPGGGAGALQRLYARFRALATAACGGRACRCSSRSRCPGMARRAAASGLSRVLLRARAPCALFDAERRPRGGLVVLRRGVPAGQPALDAAGAAGAVLRLAAARGGGGFDAALFLKIWVGSCACSFRCRTPSSSPTSCRRCRRSRCSIASLPEERARRDLSLAPRSVTVALALGARARLPVRAGSRRLRRSAASTFWPSAGRWRRSRCCSPSSGLYVLSAPAPRCHASRPVPGGRLVPGGTAARCAPPRRSRRSTRASRSRAPFRRCRASAPLYSVATYDQTLPFYWGRTVGSCPIGASSITG